MASKIPGFTSGIKPPTTSSQLPLPAIKRRPDIPTNASTSQPAEKRVRTTDDAHSEFFIWFNFVMCQNINDFNVFFCFKLYHLLPQMLQVDLFALNLSAV
jgi:hypothetical protein